MKKFSIDETAKLAGIDLDNSEKKYLKGELGEIMEYMAVIEKAVIPDQEHGGMNTTPSCLRADTPSPGMDISQIEKNAPKFSEGLFIVPAVLKEE